MERRQKEKKKEKKDKKVAKGERGKTATGIILKRDKRCGRRDEGE